MNPKTKQLLGILMHAGSSVVGLVVLALGVKQGDSTLEGYGAAIAAAGLASFGWAHAVLGNASNAAKQIEAMRPLIAFLPPDKQALAKVVLGDVEEGLAQLSAAQKPAAGGYARLGLLLGLAPVVAALGLLFATAANADPVTGGCFGIAHLHCGPAATLFEWKPAQGNTVFSPGAGPAADYHLGAVDLGLALLGVGALDLKTGLPNIQGTVVPFIALGENFGAFHGSSVGVAFDLGGTGGGVFNHFTWRNNFGIIIQLGPDLMYWLHSIIDSGMMT